MPKKIKKIISIIGVGGGGANPMMENSIMFLLFFFEPFPKCKLPVGPPARIKAVKFGLDFYLIQNKALVEIEYDGVKTELTFELSISYEL